MILPPPAHAHPRPPTGTRVADADDRGRASWRSRPPATRPTPGGSDRPTFDDRTTIALAKARIDASAWTPTQAGGSPDQGRLAVLVLAGVGTLVMALLAGLMVTALALADARADVATLAAVGAEPRVRRWMAASSAGLVSLLGCVVGAASGLLLSWLLLDLVASVASRLSVPWGLVAVVALGIPVVTAAVAWLSTRGRVPLARRVEW